MIHQSEEEKEEVLKNQFGYNQCQLGCNKTIKRWTAQRSKGERCAGMNIDGITDFCMKKERADD